MCEIIVSPPNFEQFIRRLNIWKNYFPYLCELSLSLCFEGVDHTHNRPLIHVPACLYCGEAVLGRGGMAEEVDEQSKSRPRPFSSFHLSHYFWFNSL